jgi:hypothetical protein
MSTSQYLFDIGIMIPQVYFLRSQMALFHDHVDMNNTFIIPSFLKFQCIGSNSNFAIENKTKYMPLFLVHAKKDAMLGVVTFHNNVNHLLKRKKINFWFMCVCKHYYKMWVQFISPCSLD